MHVTVECLLFARILIYEALLKYNSCVQKQNTTRDTCKIKTLQTPCLPKSWPYMLANFKHCTLNTPLISHLYSVTPHLVT